MDVPRLDPEICLRVDKEIMPSFHFFSSKREQSNGFGSLGGKLQLKNRKEDVVSHELDNNFLGAWELIWSHVSP